MKEILAPKQMIALILTADGKFSVQDAPLPDLLPGWALLKVLVSGICHTDLELFRGYKSFHGIPGHEFVGEVVAGHANDLIGQRVVADINVGCGDCTFCNIGNRHHCQDRRVLGMIDLPGSMAQYCMLPEENLLSVPSSMPTHQAVFAEPLAAATRILHQVPIDQIESAIVLGDGPIGILSAWVLGSRVSNVSICGHHGSKVRKAAWKNIKLHAPGDPKPAKAQLVVDATGSATGLGHALSLCQPQGTIIVKTTTADAVSVDLAPMVINEISMIGSRCGNLEDALQFLGDHPDLPLDRLVSAVYPLESAVQAVKSAASNQTLKVLMEMESP